MSDESGLSSSVQFRAVPQADANPTNIRLTLSLTSAARTRLAGDGPWPPRQLKDGVFDAVLGALGMSREDVVFGELTFLSGEPPH